MHLALKKVFKFSKIGFVGLGNMGFPMAINLAKRGHKVFAFDIDHSKGDEAAKHGITFRKEVREVAGDAEVFVTMLPNSEHSLSVCHSEGGTIPFMQVCSKAQRKTLW